MSRDAVEARCPGCQRNLRIPAGWVGKAMRCRFCGHVMQARRKVHVPTNGAADDIWVAEAVTSENLPEYAPSNGYYSGAGAHRLDDSYAAAYESSGRRHRGRGRYRGAGSGGFGKWLIVVGATALTAALVTIVVLRPDVFSTKPPENGGKQVVNKPEEKPGPAVKAPALAGPFPRRLLAVAISNYLYANPIHYGDSHSEREADRHDIHSVVIKMADRWRIPKDQVFELTDGPTSDGTTGLARRSGRFAKQAVPLGLIAGPRSAGIVPETPPPLKETIRKTVELFCATSRPQDRIIFLFVGHAVEKDGQVYLVPLEGDLDDLTSLIPLKDIYEPLGKCPAQEKVVIWDVCRFDPQRGTERPSFGVMTPALEKALHSPPPGVSVWTACSAEQYSYEEDYAVGSGGRDAWGGFFLSEFLNAAAAGVFNKNGKKGGIQTPDEPLPLKPLEEYVSKATEELAKGEVGGKQRPKFTDAAQPRSVPYEPNEPLAASFDIPAPPSADTSEVVAILNEIRVPPVKAIRKDLIEPKFDSALVFTRDALKEYKSDANADEILKNPAEYPLQAAVLTAAAELRNLQGERESELPEQFSSPINDARKANVRVIQRTVATREAILLNQKEKLEKVAMLREKETSKRWQAHYDYILAQVKLRIAYIREYNLALGKITKEEVPALDTDKKQIGWRLAATTKMKSDKETRDLADEARETLSNIVKEHLGTPWAMLAKRERHIALGLEWQPYATSDEPKR
jgi:hypothetical protein